MRDDERYPTLVERRDGENAPEVVPPPIDHFGADKQASDGNAASASVSGSYWTGSPMGGTPFIPLKTDDGSMPEAIEPGGAPAATAHRTICGIRRRTFWIIVIIVSTAVLGGVLGGIIGGLANDGQLFTSDDEDDNGAPASTQTSGPIEPSQRAMAVSISVSDDGADQELQLFYQDLDTQAILYRRIRNDEARDEKTVALNHVPLWASPLAAAAINKSDPVSTQLFYMTADDDGRPAVAVAKLKCVADKEACTTDANDIISGGEDSDVALHPDTKLAALRLGDDTIRLYYQDEGGAIFALNGDDADNDQGGQWTAHAITDAAAPGSSFVAVGPRKEDISVFYISESNETLSLVQYSDLQGPGDAVAIDERPGSEWTVNVSLAGVNVPLSDPYRVYYASPDNGVIVAYWQPTDADAGNFSINHNDNWGTVQGGFAAAAWADQVRMYYFNDGNLVVSAQDINVWAEMAPLAG